MSLEYGRWQVMVRKSRHEPWTEHPCKPATLEQACAIRLDLCLSGEHEHSDVRVASADRLHVHVAMSDEACKAASERLREMLE